jgi:ankyrin repeat protein
VWACRTLLSLGANPNARDINGHSPLHHAAFQGSRGNVTAMLQFGGDKRLRGDDGVPPYVFALLGEHELVAEILYFEDTALVTAVRDGEIAKLERLLGDGADPMQGGSDGWCAAHEIAAGCNWDALDAIEAHNADALEWDVQTEYGQTPLMLATANKHPEMAAYILEKLADPAPCCGSTTPTAARCTSPARPGTRTSRSCSRTPGAPSRTRTPTAARPSRTATSTPGSSGPRSSPTSARTRSTRP